LGGFNIAVKATVSRATRKVFTEELPWLKGRDLEPGMGEAL
jgi:hypothetical protein